MFSALLATAYAHGSVPTPTYPIVDESLDRLLRAGWSVGDAAFGPEHALVWCVSGSNGENRVDAMGRTRAEAYWRACIQAREVGMLAAPRQEDAGYAPPR
jgi:hypothetical protein